MQAAVEEGAGQMEPHVLDGPVIIRQFYTEKSDDASAPVQQQASRGARCARDFEVMPLFEGEIT